MDITICTIAKMIDHSLLHPTLTDQQLREGCELAKTYDVASVCIKPYAVPMAKELLKDSTVAVGTVVGFPHGSHRIDVKIREAEYACDDGAVELDLVLNIGKVLSCDWDYVAQELNALAEVANRRNVLLKVIFENDYLTTDAFKIKLCHLCNAQSVDFVKTSTGYGFVKQPDGSYNYAGATDHDLQLMRNESLPHIQVKAAGKIRTLNDLLRVRALGVTRIGATTTDAIIAEAKQRGYK